MIWSHYEDEKVEGEQTVRRVGGSKTVIAGTNSRQWPTLRIETSISSIEGMQ
jgi:hypothetical protein